MTAPHTRTIQTTLAAVLASPPHAVHPLTGFATTTPEHFACLRLIQDPQVIQVQRVTAQATQELCDLITKQPVTRRLLNERSVTLSAQRTCGVLHFTMYLGTTAIGHTEGVDESDHVVFFYLDAQALALIHSGPALFKTSQPVQTVRCTFTYPPGSAATPTQTALQNLSRLTSQTINVSTVQLTAVRIEAHGIVMAAEARGLPPAFKPRWAELDA